MFIRGGDHSGRAEGLLLLLRGKPPGFKEMQPVALPGQRPQQLHQPASAFPRIGVGHHHGVLGGVPVAQPHPSAHLDKGGEPGEHHIDLALVQIPDIQFYIHSGVGGVHLQAAQLFVPEFRRPGEILLHLFGGILPAHGFARFYAALPQQINELRLLSGLQGQVFFQAAAVVASLFEAAAAFSRLHRHGISFRAVSPQEAVPAAVEAIRRKVGGEELIALFLIVEVVFNDAVLIPAAGGIQAHLEILIVHGDLMEAELQVGKHGKPPHPVRIVAQSHLPDLHRVVHGHKQGLPGVDAGIVAVVLAVAQTVTAGIVLLGLANGLPGYRPIVAAVVIAQIDIVPRPIHGHAIGAEAGDAVVLRRFVEQIAPGDVVEHTVHFMQADVICPGYRHIHPVDHIFPVLIIKITIPHRLSLPFCIFRIVSVYQNFRPLHRTGNAASCLSLSTLYKTISKYNHSIVNISPCSRENHPDHC